MREMSEKKRKQGNRKVKLHINKLEEREGNKEDDKEVGRGQEEEKEKR